MARVESGVDATVMLSSAALDIFPHLLDRLVEVLLCLVLLLADEVLCVMCGFV